MGRRTKTGVTPRGVSIQISFVWRDMRFRETLNLEPTEKNMKYARNLRGEILTRIEKNTFDPADYFPNSAKLKRLGFIKPATIFSERAEQWYNSTANLAKSTRTSYRKNLNFHILPQFGHMKLQDITYGKIMEWLGLTEWQSMKTRNNVLIPLRSVMDAAFLDGVIAVNPCARVRNAKVQKREPDPLSLDEVDTVLTYMNRYDEQVVNYFEFACFAGLRTSELIELKWGDIDFKRELAVIERAKVEGEVKHTKTALIRHIELNSRALSAIKRQKAKTFMAGEYVFNNPSTNRPWADDQMQRMNYWIPALKALGMKHRDAYQTRHTFATMNLMAGANVNWLAKQMGHTSPKMIYEIYGRWLSLADAGREKNKLENILIGNMAAHQKTNTM